MDILATILSSRARVEIFRLLLGCTTPELHNREIVRRAGLSESAIRQELQKLARIGLMIRRRDGNRVYYKANRNHALFTDLRQVVLKTCGLVDILKPKLSTASIKVAFVFGALAGAGDPEGDGVDLLVIGREGAMGLNLLLTGVTEQMGREIKPHVITESDYREKLRSGDRFVTRVMAGPRIFVIGDQRELDALAENRPELS